MKLKMVGINNNINFVVDNDAIICMLEAIKLAYEGIIDGCVITFINGKLEIWLSGEHEKFLEIDIEDFFKTVLHIIEMASDESDLVDENLNIIRENSKILDISHLFTNILQLKGGYDVKTDKKAMTYCFWHFIGDLDKENYIDESKNKEKSETQLKSQLDETLKVEEKIISVLKSSMELSKKCNFINPTLEMLFSSLISGIKKLKNSTLDLLVESDACEYLNKISIKSNNSLKITNIIDESESEFYKWYEMRKWIPFMKSIGECVGYDICEQLENVQRICDLDSEEFLILQNKIVASASETITKLFCGLKSELGEDMWKICMEGLINTSEKLN